jgi:Holliday junction resolvase
MEITKSTRHQKIIGNFGEQLVCNWLSRSGFEVMLVDHTGIDIVAFNPKTNQRLGISVKSRTRCEGTEGCSVTIFQKNEDLKKIKYACDCFGCEPWIAIYVETSTSADMYMTSLKHFDENYRENSKNWLMSPKQRERYKKDALN